MVVIPVFDKGFETESIVPKPVMLLFHYTIYHFHFCSMWYTVTKINYWIVFCRNIYRQGYQHIPSCTDRWMQDTTTNESHWRKYWTTFSICSKQFLASMVCLKGRNACGKRCSWKSVVTHEHLAADKKSHCACTSIFVKNSIVCPARLSSYIALSHGSTWGSGRERALDIYRELD